MPLTNFQRLVLQLLKQHRNPNSYVAGGIAIHCAADSLRCSNDIDFFHDADEAVSLAARLDRELLSQNGFLIQNLIEQPSFVRSVISKASESLKLEWVRDTAFRFFPVLADDELGYRLHDIDLMVNKCLALANRNAVRDIVDLMHLSSKTLSLTAACWAACGKDPGFTPQLLVDCMRRNSIIRPEQLAAESLTRKLSAQQLKKEWIEMLDRAARELDQFPVADLGCIFLDSKSQVIHHPELPELPDYQRHFGKIGGSWPRIVTE